MDLGVLLLLYCLLAGFVTFVMLCGHTKPFRDGPVGTIYWLLTEAVPKHTAVGLRRVFGMRLATLARRAVNCLTQTAHPLLQIMYVLLVAAGSIAFYTKGAYRIPNEHIPGYHNYVIPAVIGMTLVSFIKASMVDPGKLTPNNIERMTKMYPYDGLIFPGPNECRTCMLIKPARSKHCSLCQACIARNCHHCPWINNCVGLYSHRYFLWFLFSNLMLTGYGSYICFWLIYKDIRLVAHLNFLSLTHKAAFVLQRDPYIASLFLFTSLVWLMIGAFFFWHLYMVAINVTTNESFKWDDIKENVKEGVLFVVADDTVKSETLPMSQKSAGGLEPTANVMKSMPSASERDPAIETGCTTTVGLSEKTASRQRKCRTADSPAGKAHRKPQTVEGQSHHRPDLIPVKDFKELKNIYNKGVLSNLLEVLFPTT